MTVHLRPTAELAERVILPGDPGRALLLAQQLLERPLMFNHQRGLWGYTGAARDGELLTIQSTGMGGPSAAIVAEELIELGARRLVRAGTCGMFTDNPPGLGGLIVVSGAHARDGTSAALEQGDRVLPDAQLTAALEVASATEGVDVVSADLFYDPRTDVNAGWLADGAVAVEMEAATVLAVARRHGVAAGCVLLVSDVLASARVRLTDEQIADGAARLGEVAAAALLRPA